MYIYLSLPSLSLSLSPSLSLSLSFSFSFSLSSLCGIVDELPLCNGCSCFSSVCVLVFFAITLLPLQAGDLRVQERLEASRWWLRWPMHSLRAPNQDPSQAPSQEPSQAPNQEPSFNATPEILQKQKLGDPSDKVMTGIDCGEDPTASLGSPVCHELPQETNVKPLVRISPSQKQDSPAHFTEQFSTDSSNEGDTSCETLIDSETSEGDSSGKTCSYSQNLSEESDDEVQEIFRPLNSAVIPLFEKFLTPSDADPKMARLVIPKKSAEAYFPKVTEAHGFPIVFQDTQRKEWEFNLRFWVNCNSKMYVLEGLKEYMTLMQWQAGDKVTFHRIEPEGKFLIATKKTVKPPPKEQPSTTR